MGLPDPESSRAVLIGTARYEADDGLDDLAAVANNLRALSSVLCDPSVSGMQPEHCIVVPNPRVPADIAAKVDQAATEAGDMLLIYYAGHGLLDDKGELRLGVTTSTRAFTRFDSFEYAGLRSILARSRAKKRVVILDCCFSGKAIGMMGDPVDLATGQVEVSGTCTLTATSETKPAHAPPGAEFTAFTEQLLHVLREGVPDGPELLDMMSIYSSVHRALTVAGLPAPRQKGTDTASIVQLARNAAASRVTAGASTVGTPVTAVASLPEPSHRAAPASVLPTHIGSSRGSARLWDTKNGEEVARFRLNGQVNSVAFRPDGALMATANGERAARIWDIASGRELTRIEHAASVSTVAFSPDGERIATTSSDKTAFVWDLNSGRELARMEHNDWVLAIAFSPDGHQVATGGADLSTRIWDPTSGEQLTELCRVGVSGRPRRPRRSVRKLVGIVRPMAGVWGLSFSPDGSFIGTAGEDNSARVWSIESGREVRTEQHVALVWDIALGPRTEQLATAGFDNAACIWQPDGGVTRLEHKAAVRAIAFDPLGDRIASGGEDETARVWDAENGREIMRISLDEKVWDVTFSPDGQLLATAS